MTPMTTYELLTPETAPAVLTGARCCPYCRGHLTPTMRLVSERENGVERVAHWLCSLEEAAA